MTTITTTEIVTWEARIRPHLASAVESIVAAGAEMIAAKTALPHGEFGMLCTNLGITTRTAQRFMQIARHPVLSNPTHASHLPPAWSTLAELTKLDETETVAAIEAGEITPRLDRGAAKIVVATYVTNRECRQEQPEGRMLSGAEDPDRSQGERIELGVRSKRRKEEFGVFLLTFSTLSISSLHPDWIRTLTTAERDEWVDYCRRSEAGIRRLRRQLERLDLPKDGVA